MTEPEAAGSGDRAAAFRADVGGVRVRGGTVARERLLARIGVALLLGGCALGVVAYTLSHGTTNPLQQRDAVVVALIGVSVTVTGAALFLRYSLGAVLRLWLARLVADRET